MQSFCCSGGSGSNAIVMCTQNNINKTREMKIIPVFCAKVEAMVEF